MLCELCGCEEHYNFHHFIPRTTHNNKWFKKNFSREDMKKGLSLCKQCHKTIHAILPNEKELGKKYNSLEKLLAHPKIKRYVKWKRQRKSPNETTT